MQYRRLGNTDLQVSTVCMGGGRLSADSIGGSRIGAIRTTRCVPPPTRRPSAHAIRLRRGKMRSVRFLGALLGVVLLSAVGADSALAQTADSRRELAQLRADLNVVSENCHTLHNSMQTLQRENRRLRASLRELSGRVAELEGRNRTLQKALGAAENRIVAEKKARASMADKIVATVTKEVRSLLGREGGGGATEDGSMIPIRGEYSVQHGDTLSTIAQAFDVTVTRLKQANNLSGDLIRVEQTLKIPEP